MSQYVQAAVKNVINWLEQEENKHWGPLPRTDNPLPTTYQPELDMSAELSPKEAAYYQSQIGVLRWMVELGRIDICLEVSMMSSHIALPRINHLKHLLQIFGYLNNHHNAEVVFDPTDPVINENDYEIRDWTSSELVIFKARKNCLLTCHH